MAPSGSHFLATLFPFRLGGQNGVHEDSILTKKDVTRKQKRYPFAIGRCFGAMPTAADARNFEPPSLRLENQKNRFLPLPR